MITTNKGKYSNVQNLAHNAFVSNLNMENWESVLHQQGRIQDFHLGGAQKIMCPHEHYERGTELSFGRGPGPA